VLFPSITGTQIVGILIGGGVLVSAIAIGVNLAAPTHLLTPMTLASVPRSAPSRDTWRMPPLEDLSPARLTMLNRVWLVALRAYLVVAAGLVLVRIVTLAIGGAD
jgi:hypothetical protein